MIPEEIQRLMQFILEHQAQFSVDMDKAKERMARHEELTAESNERLARHEERMARHEARMAEHAERMAEADAKAAERRAESDERIARIEGIQENTARQIEHVGNALVALTDAHEQTRQEMKELAETTQAALKELAESQAHSDRRLDALIDIVRGRAEGGQ